MPATPLGETRTNRARPTGAQLAQNRFWLLVPVLTVDVVLTGRLPAALAPGSSGSDIPGWLMWTESVLRAVVLGVPLLMPMWLRTPGARSALVIYTGGLAAYMAAWVAVVSAPNSAWSISAVGFTAPAWTSALFLAGIGWGSSVWFFRGYRPWMYLATAALFAAVHTIPVALAWSGRA